MMFFYNESPIKGIKKNYQSKLNPLQKFKKKPNKPKTKQNANFFKTSQQKNKFYVENVR